MKTEDKNTTPFIQVIYSKVSGGQETANLKLVPGLFDSKEYFIETILWAFDCKHQFYDTFQDACAPNPPFRDNKGVHYLSCCVYTAGQDIKTPDWYHACNGKFITMDLEADL